MMYFNKNIILMAAYFCLSFGPYILIRLYWASHIAYILSLFITYLTIWYVFTNKENNRTQYTEWRSKWTIYNETKVIKLSTEFVRASLDSLVIVHLSLPPPLQWCCIAIINVIIINICVTSNQTISISLYWK